MQITWQAHESMQAFSSSARSFIASMLASAKRREFAISLSALS
jgi:hypothetical protein